MGNIYQNMIKVLIPKLYFPFQIFHNYLNSFIMTNLLNELHQKMMTLNIYEMLICNSLFYRKIPPNC